MPKFDNLKNQIFGEKKTKLNTKNLILPHEIILFHGSIKYRLITLRVVWPIVRRWRDHARWPN